MKIAAKVVEKDDLFHLFDAATGRKILDTVLYDLAWNAAQGYVDCLHAYSKGSFKFTPSVDMDSDEDNSFAYLIGCQKADEEWQRRMSANIKHIHIV